MYDQRHSSKSLCGDSSKDNGGRPKPHPWSEPSLLSSPMERNIYCIATGACHTIIPLKIRGKREFGLKSNGRIQLSLSRQPEPSSKPSYCPVVALIARRPSRNRGVFGGPRGWRLPHVVSRRPPGPSVDPLRPRRASRQ